MSLEKCRTLMKAFIESQFNYCSLIWMLHSRTLNNKINHIHETVLKTVYSSFNELLDEDSSFSIHQRNVQSLAIEIYKYLVSRETKVIIIMIIIIIIHNLE